MPSMEVEGIEPALKSCANMVGPLHVKAVLKEPALTALEHTRILVITSLPELFRRRPPHAALRLRPAPGPTLPPPMAIVIDTCLCHTRHVADGATHHCAPLTERELERGRAGAGARCPNPLINRMPRAPPRGAFNFGDPHRQTIHQNTTDSVRHMTRSAWALRATF